MHPPNARVRRVTHLLLLIMLGTAIACGGPTKTKKVSVPLDTTVVDDDTLEGADAPIPKRVEHAR